MVPESYWGEFMAVAMESIKLDVTVFVPTSALPAYDVICRYAQAVVSMVIAKLKRVKIDEEDEILMMHTALACATVAEQIPHVIKRVKARWKNQWKLRWQSICI